MKVAVLGGGPAGLYFAISMKLRDAAHDITVFERNRPDDTFGWGMVLSDETLDNLAQAVGASAIGAEGVKELQQIADLLAAQGYGPDQVDIDPSVVRGLGYYTGPVFEAELTFDIQDEKGRTRQFGSVAGGGRYDDLTGIFGLKNMSGVGISFGLERIYLVLDELNLFPKAVDQSIQVLCVNFGDSEALEALKLITRLREFGVKADLYPSSVKMQKQMKYANSRKVPFVILMGAKEVQDHTFIVKNMIVGTQQTYQLENVEEFLKTL